MTKPDAAREREAFDLWAKKNGFGQSQPTTWCWEAWQARAALAEQPAPTQPARVVMSDERIDTLADQFLSVHFDEHEEPQVDGERKFARAVIAEYERLSVITPAQGKGEQG